MIRIIQIKYETTLMIIQIIHVLRLMIILINLIQKRMKKSMMNTNIIIHKLLKMMNVCSTKLKMNKH